MKIVRNTPEELALRSSIPVSTIWPIAGFLVFVAAGVLALFQGNAVEGISCIILSAVPGYFVWRDVRLDFARLNRSEDVLEIRRLSLRGHERVRHPLGDLSHAFVDQLQWGKERRSRVVLYLDRGMDEGQHPLISHHMIATRAHIAAATINAWLGDVDTRERQA
ncbi:MAG: hypothetical protein AAFP85_04700 [Pseudomonadota bacterium]